MDNLQWLTTVCLFVFGCAMAGAAIAGIRGGRYWYKTGWVSKERDGLFFWAVTVTTLIASVSVILGVIWVVLTKMLMPPPP